MGRQSGAGDVHRVLVAAKTRVPQVRSATIDRPRLTTRLAAAADLPLVVVSAPVGFGKTTLLVDWARQDGRTFAWVSLDRGDDDSVSLVRSICGALDRVMPIDPALFEDLAAPATSILGQIVPRLVASIDAADDPLVLVLNNLHEVDSQACRDVVNLLLDLLPPGVQVAVSSRREVWLAGGRRRMRGEVLELGAADLAFDESETEALLVEAGMRVTPERVRQLLQRTEGWPAGLALFALAHREDAEWIRSTAGLAAPDRVVADFIRSEVLSDLPAETSSFLHSTAILDVLCPSLCDAVVGSTNSAAILESLVAANLFITPLDAEGEWFRYHPLFRAVLLDEIVRSSGPDTLAGLHLRAAHWWADARAVEHTIEHSRAGGDLTVAARLLVRELPQAYNTGRLDLAQKWLSDLGDATIERDPVLAGLAGWHAALTGNAVAALRWADHIEQLAPAGDDGDALFVPGRAALRAFLCAHGIDQMEAEAASVVASEPHWGGWRPPSLGFLAAARWLRGDDAGASALFSESIESASALGRGDPQARNLAYRAVLSMDRDDWASAERDIRSACSVIEAVHLTEYGVSAIVRAAEARWLLHHNQTERGRAVLLEAMRLRTSVTWANPWAAVWLRLEMADAHLASADPHGASVLLHEIDEILYRRPKLGRLVARADKLRQTLALWPMDGHGTTLSAAELRLLPYLQTHLSLKEIGERLYVSRNTVSTQTNSIYRKLAVSGRSEAVDRARELGLLAPSIFDRTGVDSIE